MAATRASGACSGIEHISNNMHQKTKKEAGGGSPPPRAPEARAGGARGGPPLSRLQDIPLLLLRETFIKRISCRILLNVPLHAPTWSGILCLIKCTPHYSEVLNGSGGPKFSGGPLFPALPEGAFSASNARREAFLRRRGVAAGLPAPQVSGGYWRGAGKKRLFP